MSAVEGTGKLLNLHHRTCPLLSPGVTAADYPATALWMLVHYALMFCVLCPAQAGMMAMGGLSGHSSLVHKGKLKPGVPGAEHSAWMLCPEELPAQAMPEESLPTSLRPRIKIQPTSRLLMTC